MALKKLKTFLFMFILSLVCVYAQDSTASKSPPPPAHDINATEPQVTITGLKRTQDFYIKGILKDFLKDKTKDTAKDIDTQAIQTALHETGLFSQIDVEVTQQGNLVINVKEKLSFLPLPMAAVSDGHPMAGVFLMDTNALGVADVFMLGGLISKNTKMATTLYSHQAGDLLHPGFSLFFSAADNSTTIEDANKTKLFEYDSGGLGVGISISERFFKHFSATIGGDYSFKKAKDKEFETLHSFSGSLGASFYISNWNGVFSNSTSFGVQGKLFHYNTKDNTTSDIGKKADAFFSFQVPIVPRLRLCGNARGAVTKDTHITQLLSPGDAGVNILGGDFAATKILGATLGVEFAALICSIGTFSFYAQGEGVTAKDFLDDTIKDWGGTGGLRVYLSTINIPALSLGYSWNKSRSYGRFSFSLGMSM